MDIEATASRRDIRDAVEWGYGLILGRHETDNPGRATIVSARLRPLETSRS